MLAGKRILIVFCSFELGGAERQGLHLARYLKKVGCDVRVWGHMGPGLVAEHCDEAGIPWAIHRFRWPCRKSSLLRDGWSLLRALRKERPDVILSYTTWANMGCGLTWRWSRAQACIWSQRTVDDLCGDSFERFAYRGVSAVICNAQHEVEYLRQTFGETPAPVSVVHNGLELAPCVKTRAAWRAELGICDHTTVVTMVANLRPLKGHVTLLRAWREILAKVPHGQPQPRLLLAGATLIPDPTLDQLAGDPAIQGNVLFLGQVRDISGLLEASDVGVLCSIREGLSNAVLEYMASGLPVVATDLPGNREALAEHPRQPLCKPGDVDDLVATLWPLLNDPELRHELGARNRQRAYTVFSIEGMCKATEAIVRDLLSPRR